MSQQGKVRLRILFPKTLSLAESHLNDMSKPASLKKKWDPREVAMMINCADLCLQDGSNYMETTEKKLHELSEHDWSCEAMANKLRLTLKANDPTASVQELIQQGTTCLNLTTLPTEILSELRAQRQELNLKPWKLELARFLTTIQ